MATRNHCQDIAINSEAIYSETPRVSRVPLSAPRLSAFREIPRVLRGIGLESHPPCGDIALNSKHPGIPGCRHQLLD